MLRVARRGRAAAREPGCVAAGTATGRGGGETAAEYLGAATAASPYPRQFTGPSAPGGDGFRLVHDLLSVSVLFSKARRGGDACPLRRPGGL